jgi:hypothetical protein
MYYVIKYTADIIAVSESHAARTDNPHNVTMSQLGAYPAPIGSRIMYGSITPPAGWLYENGASLLRVGAYAGLFAIIGTAYGSVDADHFNIPDMSSYSAVGIYHIIKFSTEGSVPADHTARVDNPHGVTARQIKNVKLVTDANYTILDTDNYDVYIFNGQTADRYLYLPTLADNTNLDITVVNSGSYKVIVTPEGTDNINGWNATVEITEQYGWWRFIARVARWHGLTDGWSTIYSTELTSLDSGINLDNTWDDIAGLSLTMTGIRGKFIFSHRFWAYIGDSSLPSDIYGVGGIGYTSGNNAPDIFGSHGLGYVTIANTSSVYRTVFNIENFLYAVTSDITVYSKMKAYSNELNLSSVQCGGSALEPAYIKARRIR